jgi:hypothetical protein
VVAQVVRQQSVQVWREAVFHLGIRVFIGLDVGVLEQLFEWLEGKYTVSSSIIAVA